LLLTPYSFGEERRKKPVPSLLRTKKGIKEIKGIKGKKGLLRTKGKGNVKKVFSCFGLGE